MAIKEEARGETLETKVADTEVNSTDVNVRTGMTNDQFELYQKREVDQQIEFKDELYSAVQRGDIQRVKELTGWTRDATRPDNTIVTEVTQETHENAHLKEKEDEAKRQQQLNESNAVATGAEGPVDPLMAFLTDPFGLHNSDAKKPESYSGNNLEEAIHRGDWTAAARIMNAMRAREQNEKQDFNHDGHVAGGGSNSADGGSYTPVGQGYPGYSEDSYGNWEYQDQYGGTYNQWGYRGADNSFTNVAGTTVDATGNITLSNDESYTTFTTQPLTKEDADSSAAAQADLLRIQQGLSLTDPKPDATKIATGPAGAGIDPAPVKDPDPQKSMDYAVDINQAAKEGLGMQYTNIADPKVKEALIAARQDVQQALEDRYKEQGLTREQIVTQRKKDLAILHGSDATARQTLYQDLLKEKYTANPDLYNSVDYQMSPERLKYIHAQRQQAAAAAPAVVADGPAPTVGGGTVAGEPDATPPAEGTSVSTEPISAYGWAEDEWYYSGVDGQDGYGYMDDYGYYYEPEGRTWDEWGYEDKYDGYYWSDIEENGSLAGGYQDKNGNYVDKAGNLYLDGNYDDTKPDALAADAPPGGWRTALETAAASGTTFTMPAKDPAVAPQSVATADITPSTVTAPSTSTAPVTTSSFTAAASTVPGGSLAGLGTTGVAAADNNTVSTNTGAGSLFEDQSPDAVMTNVSQYLGSLTSFLSNSDVTRALNTFAPSSFIDFSEPITGGSTVWGTKFFDPANITAGGTAASAELEDPLKSIAPTNPYYKPSSPAGMSV